MRIYLHPKFKGQTVAQIKAYLEERKPTKSLTRWDTKLAKKLYAQVDDNLKKERPRTAFLEFVTLLYAKDKKAWRNFYYLSRNGKMFGRKEAIDAALVDAKCEQCKSVWVTPNDNGFCLPCRQDPKVQARFEERVKEKLKVEDTSVYGTKRKYPKPDEVTWVSKGFTKKDLKVLVRLKEKHIPNARSNHQQVTRFLEDLHDNHLSTWKAFTYLNLPNSKASVREQLESSIANKVCEHCNTFIVLLDIPGAPCRECRKDKGKYRLFWELVNEKRRRDYKERTGLDHHMHCPRIKKKVRDKYMSRTAEEREATRKKTKQTNLEKYGVEHPNQRPEFKEHMREMWAKKTPKELEKRRKKSLATHIKRYGKHFNQTEEYLKKSRASRLEKTGYDHNMRDPLHIKQREERSLKKWGTKNPSQHEKIRSKIRATQMKKYGGLGRGSPVLRAKIEETNLKRYGYTTPTANPKIMAKCKATWKKIYGFENPNQNPEQAAKGLKNSFRRVDVVLEGRKFIVQGQNEKRFLKVLVKKFGVRNVHTQFSKEYKEAGIAERYGWTPDFYVKLKDREYVLELKSTWTLYGAGNSYEMNVAKAKNSDVRFVVEAGKAFYTLPKRWYEHTNIAYLCYTLAHRRISKQRLDYIYRSIRAMFEKAKREYSIEANLITSGGKSLRIVDMFQLSKRPETGTYITTEDWKNRRAASRLYVRRYFNLPSKTIYARKCKIRKLGRQEAKAFFDECHIQGASRTGISYALVHDGDIVAAMCFTNIVSARGTKKKEGEYELMRYATKYNVPGGASKLLKHFERSHRPRMVVSYSDNRMFSGDMYVKHLGFEVAGKVRPSYRTVWDFFTLDVRSAQSTSRKSLSKYEWFDPNLTEKQNCINQHIPRVYDTGKVKYVKHY